LNKVAAASAAFAASHTLHAQVELLYIEITRIYRADVYCQS